MARFVDASMAGVEYKNVVLDPALWNLQPVFVAVHHKSELMESIREATDSREITIESIVKVMYNELTLDLRENMKFKDFLIEFQEKSAIVKFPGIESVECVGILVLDELFEFTNCLGGINRDRERSFLSINKTSEGPLIVSHATMEKGTQESRNNHERWSECLSRVPGANYFMQLKMPQEITYLDYLRCCQVSSSQKNAFNRTWAGTILPILGASDNPILKQEHKRFNGEWKNDAAKIELFWSDLRAGEIQKADILLNQERMLHLKRNTVEQLNLTVEDYTRRTEESLE
ncbi:hypothetical protein FBU30_004700 [Linnemannia zychae]|nr:hypothetical protein FBU30_004700 [Linnemannia zychae]